MTLAEWFAIVLITVPVTIVLAVWLLGNVSQAVRPLWSAWLLVLVAPFVLGFAILGAVRNWPSVVGGSLRTTLVVAAMFGGIALVLWFGSMIPTKGDAVATLFVVAPLLIVILAGASALARPANDAFESAGFTIDRSFTGLGSLGLWRGMRARIVVGGRTIHARTHRLPIRGADIWLVLETTTSMGLCPVRMEPRDAQRAFTGGWGIPGSSVMGLTGLREILIGDREFDQSVKIRAVDPQRAAALLTPAVRVATLACFRTRYAGTRAALDVHEKTVKFVVLLAQIDDENELRTLTRALALLADEAERVMRDSGSRSGSTRAAL